VERIGMEELAVAEPASSVLDASGEAAVDGLAV